MNQDQILLRKYNVSGPRYTSYPTVPYWNSEAPRQADWMNRFQETLIQDKQQKGISLYIHLPFCESLCTYCACNTRITVNHGVETPYIEALLKEWRMYQEILPEKPLIRDIHLGGGTPTFFQAQNLEKLIQGLLKNGRTVEQPHFSFEGHPANTSYAHLKTLAQLGFKRLSLGIQDFSPRVQKLINRRQNVEQVLRVGEQARELGYESINYDLVYGLPGQDTFSLQNTLNYVKMLRPNRIAYYSYAHVPWIKPSQRVFKPEDLPNPHQKQLFYEMGREMMLQEGYVEIGMDHFALEDDPLSLAYEKGELHRNFMGYCTDQSTALIGLGTSAISDAWTAFIQNEKKVEDYYHRIEKGDFPFFRGHLLNQEDLLIRQHILNLMCRFETQWGEEDQQGAALYEALPRLKEMEKDGLLRVEPYQLKISEKGKPFLRNICMAFDQKLWQSQPDRPLFSQVI
ncbi:MAG: oxygen-independent coproporphyrinogen III oxidase [Bacteroidota bacterium]